MAPPPLDETEIRRRLAELPGWSLERGRLRRAFSFSDFVAAFSFMTRVALAAERLGHHPDWSNVYGRVEIELWTHDAGGVTEKDFVLAAEIERAAGEQGGGGGG